jgi:hypothetical protein
MPPIAPPDRPESSLDGAVDGEEVADAELDAGAEDVGDAPGVVDVSAKSAVRSIVMEVARGEADERDVYVWLSWVELRKRIGFSCFDQQMRNCLAFLVHSSLRLGVSILVWRIGLDIFHGKGEGVLGIYWTHSKCSGRVDLRIRTAVIDIEICAANLLC